MVVRRQQVLLPTASETPLLANLFRGHTPQHLHSMNRIPFEQRLRCCRRFPHNRELTHRFSNNLEHQRRLVHPVKRKRVWSRTGTKRAVCKRTGASSTIGGSASISSGAAFSSTDTSMGSGSDGSSGIDGSSETDAGITAGSCSSGISFGTDGATSGSTGKGFSSEGSLLGAPPVNLHGIRCCCNLGCEVWAGFEGMPSAKLPMPNGRRESYTFDAPWNPNGRPLSADCFVSGGVSISEEVTGSMPSSRTMLRQHRPRPGTSVGRTSSEVEVKPNRCGTDSRKRDTQSLQGREDHRFGTHTSLCPNKPSSRQVFNSTLNRSV